jgi:hypothetical protein
MQMYQLCQDSNSIQFEINHPAKRDIALGRLDSAAA